MGSYCSINFDRLDVCGRKSVVPDEFVALFQEADRVVRVREDPDDGVESVTYVASRDVVLARLDLLGCSSEAVRKLFDAWRARELAKYHEYVSEDNFGEEELEALKLLTFDVWSARVPAALRDMYSDVPIFDEIDGRMREEDAYESWLWFGGYGTPESIRALLDACPDTETVVLDISDLVGGGYVLENDPICAARRSAERLVARPLVPTVVMGEGSSDVRILENSLNAMFPERRDYFSFFNHSELSVDGGANYLVKFLKAFAAAGVPGRIVAVFDNDVVGAQALAQARALRLPNNIILLKLPNTDLARDYPTIGAQGRHNRDVNGRAAGIELYLGRHALSLGGELRPVRWGGYVAAMGDYQGEVEGKADIVSAFNLRLASHKSAQSAQAEFPELKGVWEMIFQAVTQQAGAVPKPLPREF